MHILAHIMAYVLGGSDQTGVVELCEVRFTVQRMLACEAKQPG